MKDALDISKEILELYSQNVNKSSGEITKNSLTIPLHYKHQGFIYPVHSAEFTKHFGIVLNNSPDSNNINSSLEEF